LTAAPDLPQTEEMEQFRMNAVVSHRPSMAASPQAAGAAALLEIRDVSKVYTTRSGEDVRALSEVSLSLRDGEFVSIVGPSGCGKSTLLKLVCGLYPPSSGEIIYRGDIVRRPQRGMGVVFQTPVLLPWLTVLQNVVFPIRILRQDRAAAEARARTLLDLVGLGGFAAKYPSELSGGMQQRVGIVRSLIHDPGVLLMDEPFGALDALTRERMNIELQRIWITHRKTVFFITHSIFESVFLSDRVIVMSARPGRIIKDIRIPFARPREVGLTTTPEFGAFVSEIRDLLGASVDA
jgi:NitT/TauT family transport system ATP-binding protein